MDVADWFTVITGSIAVAAFLGSVPMVGRFVLKARIWSAKTSLSRRVNRMAHPAGRRPQAHRKAWMQARLLTGGTPYTAADELQWLTNTVGTDQSVTFSIEHCPDSGELARGYRRYATTLRMRALLFGSGQPLLDRVAGVVDEVAEILEVNADHVPVNGDARVTVARQQVTTGYVSTRPGTDRNLSSVLSLEELKIDGRFAEHRLHVSWLQELSRLPRRAKDIGDQPREYDGLLPRLVHHRYERDLSSGSYRLHLQLGETYYTDHKRNSTPPAVPPIEVEDSHGGLLTFCVLPITRDGHLILAQRSGLSYYSHCWGPGAGGNLEITSPGRTNPDADPTGVINPLRAIAREAHEEIGLFLPIERIRSMGLVRLSNSEEDGTWLLATTVTTDLSLDELTQKTIEADLIHGRWEVGDCLASVPLPRSPAAAEGLLSWALRNERAMPHLTASLLKLITSEWPLDPLRVFPRPSDKAQLPPRARMHGFGQKAAPDEELVGE